jgi:hypothetical protein
MNHLKILPVVLCCLVAFAGLAFSNPQSSWASPSEKSAKKELPVKETGNTDQYQGHSQRKEGTASQAMPMYRPPLRGSPGGRVGGGTRGVPRERALLLYALAPDHVGLTVHEQPSLYWFISDLPSSPIEFTLIEIGSELPLIEERIESPKNPGIQRIPLAEYPIHLQENRRYKWLIALAPEPKARTKGVFVGGFIERIPVPGNLMRRLQKAGRSGEHFVYAEEGIWYDALTAVSELIEKTPREENLRRERASLLEQVGLNEVSTFDSK